MKSTKTRGVAERVEPKNAMVEQIRTLFDQARELEPKNDIAGARKIERQVAKLVANVAAEAPNSRDHAEALQFHEYTLLSLSRTSKRKNVSKKFKDAAYARGAEAVDMLLAMEPELGTGFAAYNLAIDLIVSEGRPEEGLQYMLAARKLLKALPKKQIPRRFDYFYINFGIAKAYKDLGDLKKADKWLRRGLKPTKILKKFDNWAMLGGIGKLAELFREVKLAQMDAASEKEAARTAKKATRKDAR